MSYNVRELLEPCLESLAREIRSANLSAETWVVDNASSDGSAEMVRARFPDVRLEAQETNSGFAAANNVALRAWVESRDGCPDFVLMLNPDTAMRPGALGVLCRALVDTRRAGMVGPRLEFADGRLQHGAFRYPGVAQTLLDLFPVARLYDSRLNGRYSAERYDRTAPFEVDFVLGACMLVRGAAVAEVGVMDEGFRMYCEEIDWCRRLTNAGYRVLCVPEARVIHHGGASTSQVPLAMFVEKWRSRRRYFAKHETAWRRRLVEGLLRTALRTRAIADMRSASRGELSEHEVLERRQAYAAILSD